MGISKLSVVYVQDGARMHYAQPLALHRQGVLCALYTDWYNDKSRLATVAIRVAQALRPAEAIKMAQRRHEGLGGVPIFQSGLLGLVRPLAFGQSRPLSTVGWWALRQIALSEAKRGPLAGLPAFPDAVVGPMHCFTPENVRLYQGRGIRVVVDQVIAPFRELLRQRDLQLQYWPQWQRPTTAPLQQRELEVEEATLELVDRIVAPSKYVADSLAGIGHGPGRVSLLEYPLDAGAYRIVDRTTRSGPIVVGFVGAVNLRKGIPWLAESLKLLDKGLFKCVVVGPIGLSDYGLTELKKVAEVVGPVPRAQVRAWLEKFDIFFFPSTCEGSPTVVAEAMAMGLPVITSIAGGQLIREGIDGFVRPYDQPDQYAQCITLLAQDKQWRLAMGAAARQRVEEFSIDVYGKGLQRIIESLIIMSASGGPLPVGQTELKLVSPGIRGSSEPAHSPSASSQSQIRVAWLIKGDEDGGVAQAVRGLVSAAVPLGVEPVILSFSDGIFVKECIRRGWKVCELNLEPPPGLIGNPARKMFTYLRLRQRTASLAPSVANAVRDCGAQVLHVLWPNLVPLAGKSSQLAGVRCFWEMPNVISRFPLSLNRRVLSHALAKYGITALANSRYTQASLDPDGRNSLLFYLGADPDRFYPAHKDAVTRSDLDIPADAIVLAIMARLSPEKGQYMFLGALAPLAEKHNLHLLLLGGPLGTRFHQELLIFAGGLGCQLRVHFIDNVPNPECYYDLIDIAVNVRLDAEPFGLSVVEAMMASKPVLVHALGGPAETVLDGVTGWHVAQPTVEALRAGLQRALSDRPKWAQMGDAARQRALETFNLEDQARRYAEILHRRAGAAAENL